MRGSILGELFWLLYFLALLVVAVYLVNIFLVPHHFNVAIANVLAAIAAGLAYIGTRGYRQRRGKR